MYVIHKPGDTVGKIDKSGNYYTIISNIGTGNDSIVYMARAYNNEIVALKTFVNNNKSAFARELRFANMSKVYLGHFSYNDAHYVVNKYLPLDFYNIRALLQTIIISREMRMGLTRYLITKLFMCLDFIHSGNVIHCDISTKNIMINKDVKDFAVFATNDILAQRSFIESIEVYLIDFGSSCNVQDNCKSCYIGTPGYIAPEIIFNQKYNQAIDVFAATIVAVEMIVGNYLFDVFYIYGYDSPNTNNEELATIYEKIESYGNLSESGSEIDEDEDEDEEIETDSDSSNFDESATTEELKVLDKLDISKFTTRAECLNEIRRAHKHKIGVMRKNNTELMGNVFLKDGIYDSAIQLESTVDSDFQKVYIQLYLMEKFYHSMIRDNIFSGFEGCYYNVNRKLKYHSKLTSVGFDTLLDILGYNGPDAVFSRDCIKKLLFHGACINPASRFKAKAMAGLAYRL